VDQVVKRRTVALVLAAAAGGLSACGTPGSSTATRAPIVVSVQLQQGRVPTGSPVAGVATLTNNTTKTVTVETCAANGWLDVGLSDPSIPYQPATRGVACPPSVRLAPGPNRFPITISTTYEQCTPHPNELSARQHEPPCGPAGMPALPVGHYTTSVVVTGLPKATALPKPRVVTLLPPVGVAWSDEVLAAAALPPGAIPTAVAVPTLRSWGQSLPHQVDVHRLYLVPGSRASIAAFLLRHLPLGASNNQGIMVQTDPVSYDAEFIPLTMPAKGPNENLATLLYAFAADGPGTQELRIDAETTSVPMRSPYEYAAPTGRVVVTGYGQLSLAGGPSSPVSVTLTGARARQVRWAFDRLGLGESGGCMEFVSPYTIKFFDNGSRSSALTATDFTCGGDNVGVATSRRTGYTLADPHCRLLAEVVSVLPARTASATRGSLKACRATYVG
jgi:hypothetical protein